MKLVKPQVQGSLLGVGNSTMHVKWKNVAAGLSHNIRVRVDEGRVAFSC